jgi:hypothetical protein
MPGIGAGVDVVAFPHFVDAEHVNTKFRTLEQKAFCQEPDAPQLFYGLDDLKNQVEGIIVEGEIDKLSLEEAGYVNAISVPNGASTSLIYLERSASHIAHVQRWVIAVDTDEKGKALAEALAARLGIGRCRFVVWPESCKDANDVLVRLGADAVRACIEAAQPYKLPESAAAGPSETHVGALPGTDADLSALPESCEEALALGFASRFGLDLRYVHGWHQWRVWKDPVGRGHSAAVARPSPRFSLRKGHRTSGGEHPRCSRHGDQAGKCKDGDGGPRPGASR